MSRLPIVIAFCIAFACSLVAAPAAAQSRVLLLLTETTTTQGSEPDVAFWWAGASTPEWTETDQMLVGGDLATIDPGGLEGLSRIYRRPDLSDANAAALAELFSADVALVGTVERTELPLNPLGAKTFRVRIDARLVAPGAQGVIVKQTFSVERLAARGDNALMQATQDATRTLGNLANAALKRRIGPVGVAETERLIAFQGVADLAQWRAIEGALTERPDVDSVEVAWLSEGIVTVRINPQTEETTDAVDRIVRGMQNHIFDAFALAAAPDLDLEGATALRITNPNL